MATTLEADSKEKYEKIDKDNYSRLVEIEIINVKEKQKQIDDWIIEANTMNLIVIPKDATMEARAILEHENEMRQMRKANTLTMAQQEQIKLDALKKI